MQGMRGISGVAELSDLQAEGVVDAEAEVEGKEERAADVSLIQQSLGQQLSVDSSDVKIRWCLAEVDAWAGNEGRMKGGGEEEEEEGKEDVPAAASTAGTRHQRTPITSSAALRLPDARAEAVTV